MGKVDMDISILLPAALPAPALVAGLAVEMERYPLARVYQGESLVECPFTQLQILAERHGVACGLSVAVMPLRHPVAAAMQADAVAARSGAPVVLGIGPGAPEIQELLLGERYSRPIVVTREYVRAVRRSLNQPARGAETQAAPLFGSVPLPRLGGQPGQVLVGVGVLRPAMARMAGAEADLLIAHAPPVDYLTEVLMPACEAGAATSGRVDRPRTALVLPVALADVVDSIEALARVHAGHVMAPHYRAMYDQAGVIGDGTGLLEATRQVVGSRAIFHGSEDHLVEHLGSLADLGVNEVILDLSATYISQGVEPTLASLGRILRASPFAGC